ENKGFDFFVLTDHENVGAWTDPGYRSNKMTLLYGVEWSNGGHANIWSNLPFDWSAIAPTVNADGGAKAAIDTAHALRQPGQEVLFSINHPKTSIACSGCEWTYSFEDSVMADCMEIWNAGYIWPNTNFLTVTQTINEYLGRGKKISLVGGSDSHIHNAAMPLGSTDPAAYENYVQTYYHDLGMPTTWVYAKSKGATDILDGIRRGHVCITHSWTGPQIQLWADPDYVDGGQQTYEILMGDALPASSLGKEVRFRVRVFDAKMTDLTAGASAVVVMKNGQPLTETVSLSEDYVFDFTDTPVKGDYYYVELKQPDLVSALPGEIAQFGILSAITNPIYTW
ncbi:MAG: CehA/McbA family metallohydrolase, partial [Smithellaceae bacterium]|nr:CehA/McbA family metallohydrolase [Smithellaceae bacterium]